MRSSSDRPPLRTLLHFRSEKFLAFFAPAQGVDDGTVSDYFWAKKAAHVALFVILAFCLSRASIFGAKLNIGSILLIGALVGATSKCIQFLFPSREPTMRDFCINVTATLCGALLFQKRGVPRGKRKRVRA